MLQLAGLSKQKILPITIGINLMKFRKIIDDMERNGYFVISRWDTRQVHGDVKEKIGIFSRGNNDKPRNRSLL